VLRRQSGVDASELDRRHHAGVVSSPDPSDSESGRDVRIATMDSKDANAGQQRQDGLLVERNGEH
jgi:hypothetical protein